MRTVMTLIALLSYAALVVAEDCDCSSYPFKPNPPCYGHCVAKLSAETPAEWGIAVRNIDPGVLVGIRVLSVSSDRSSIDFKSIKGKPDLERAALKSMKAAESQKMSK